MKRVAMALGAAAFFSAASAQQADPALDDLSPLPAGPSELDALSQGEQTDFPDIDRISERKPVSVTLRALNKVTAKYSDIVIKMGETGKFGALEITARYCDKRPPEEFPETTAFVEIVDKSRKLESDLKRVPEKKAIEAPAVAALETAAPEHADAGSLAPASTGERVMPENMIFSGWMFASSPALNGVEHPVYDVWVIDCKTVTVDN
jgi:hypothetical protein